MDAGYAAQRQFVGVDLARRRSVIARMDPGGELVDCVQIDNSERSPPAAGSCASSTPPLRDGHARCLDGPAVTVAGR